MKKILFFVSVFLNYALGATNAEIFTNIYKKDIWGNGSA